MNSDELLKKLEKSNANLELAGKGLKGMKLEGMTKEDSKIVFKRKLEEIRELEEEVKRLETYNEDLIVTLREEAGYEDPDLKKLKKKNEELVEERKELKKVVDAWFFLRKNLQEELEDARQDNKDLRGEIAALIKDNADLLARLREETPESKEVLMGMNKDLGEENVILRSRLLRMEELVDVLVRSTRSPGKPKQDAPGQYS